MNMIIIVIIIIIINTYVNTLDFSILNYSNNKKEHKDDNGWVWIGYYSARPQTHYLKKNLCIRFHTRVGTNVCTRIYIL